MHRAWGIVGLLGFVTGCEVSAQSAGSGMEGGGGAATTSSSTSGTGILVDACTVSPPGCPSAPLTTCNPVEESEHTLLVDVASPELGATEIVDLSGDAILVRLANGQPAVIYQSVHTNDFVVAAVSSPHEPNLQPVGLGSGITLLCGASSCALYDILDETLVLAAFDPVPLPPEDVRGVIRTNAFPDDPECAPSPGTERLVCVYGKGVACLVDGSNDGWTVVAPASATDAFLAAAQLTPRRIRFVGEGGRMGRVDPSSASELTWTEEERVTTASLRAVQTFGLQAGDIVGDDGTFLTFTRDNVAACDTGDQDWLLAPGEGHILSATGDVYRGGCVAQLPPGRSYRLATFYEAGTTWGLRYADTQRVYEEMTGFTE